MISDEKKPGVVRRVKNVLKRVFRREAKIAKGESPETSVFEPVELKVVDKDAEALNDLQ